MFELRATSQLIRGDCAGAVCGEGQIGREVGGRWGWVVGKNVWLSIVGEGVVGLDV